MELPSRPKNDRYTRPGQYNELERRLRANPDAAQIPVLVCYAFDFRTRLGPFLFADMRLLTAGPRAIAAALYQAGFTQAAHRAAAVEPQRSAQRGPPRRRAAADAVRLQHADPQRQRLRADRGCLPARRRPAVHPGRRRQGHLRAVGLLRLVAPTASTAPTWLSPARSSWSWSCSTASWNLGAAANIRARRSIACAAPGLLDDIPGLVFREGDEKAPLGRLINTGIQRMVQDLDELPHPIVSLALLEPPHRRRTLASPADPGRQAAPLCRHGLAGDDARLQVPLPLLPDPGLQPVHLPLQESRPAARRDGEDRRADRHPHFLRHRRQLLQQPRDGRGDLHRA